MPIRPEMRDRYPPDWELRSYFVRFVRAKGCCEKCGAKHGKPHPVTGSKVVLTTAHVYDHRPEAASLLNLAGWCQRCHNRHDAAMRAEGKRQRAIAQASNTLPRPCPKCSGAVVLETIKVKTDRRRPGPSYHKRCRCQSCGLSTPAVSDQSEPAACAGAWLAWGELHLKFKRRRARGISKGKAATMPELRQS